MCVKVKITTEQNYNKDYITFRILDFVIEEGIKNNIIITVLNLIQGVI